MRNWRSPLSHRCPPRRRWWTSTLLSFRPGSGGPSGHHSLLRPREWWRVPWQRLIGTAPGGAVPTDRGSPGIETVEFTVQIEAFRTRLQAEELLAVLQRGGYVAYIFEPDRTESPSYFRVRVGQFPTQEEARELGSNLRRRFPRQVRDFLIIPYEQ